MNFANTFKHWKTTTQPIFTVILFVSPFLADPNCPWHPGKSAAWVIGLTATAAKLAIGATQQDPGKELANVPGEDKPVLVDSHEVPNDPNAKVVK